jgi:hypothetical protein
MSGMKHAEFGKVEIIFCGIQKAGFLALETRFQFQEFQEPIKLSVGSKALVTGVKITVLSIIMFLTRTLFLK